MSNSDIYDRKVSSKIKLKGISKLYKKKKKESQNVDNTDDRKNKDNSINEFFGTGRIVSSGTTVQGFETKFFEEFSVGDYIVIDHPMTHGSEVRVVESILSNRTLSITEPFSVDLITTIPYNIRKQRVDSESNNLKEDEPLKLKMKNISTISVREKTGMWSYKNITKSVKGNLSAEDRLNERIKMSRDKYCW